MVAFFYRMERSVAGSKGRVSALARVAHARLFHPGTGMAYEWEKGLKKRPTNLASKQQVSLTKAHTARPHKGA